MAQESTKIEFTEVIKLLEPHRISFTASIESGIHMLVANLNTPLQLSFARNGGRLDLVSTCELGNPDTVLALGELKNRIARN